MEWIKDYWYIILLGLIAAMFLFGHRTSSARKGNVHEHQEETNTDKKAEKKSHGCCG